MDFNQFHFRSPEWLWALLIIPLLIMAYAFFFKKKSGQRPLEKIFDVHLLKFLMVDKALQDKKKGYKGLGIVSLVCFLFILALAGPRWNYREIESFSRDQSLVILLDLSESMNTEDLKPSRIVRARQKIEDLLEVSKDIKVGLIAFAADPHMITPLTDDKETIRHTLPALDTGLVYVQGSRLSSALDMAENLLNAEPGSNKAILLVSDGGFEDSSAMAAVKNLNSKGIKIFTLGIGTLEGAPLKDHSGQIIKKNGSMVISKLDKERLMEIAKIGQGRYWEAKYTNKDEKILVAELNNETSEYKELSKKNKLWDESFYFLAFPLIPFFLFWFRKGAFFALIFFMTSTNFANLANLQGFEKWDLFKNSQELGKEAFEAQNYEAASQFFQDPYQKGVSFYRNQNYAEAEKMFLESEKTISSTYNLGNSLAMQQKYQEALIAYEEVLKEDPGHIQAKENYDLVKSLMKQEEDKDPKKDQDKDKNQEKEDKKDDKKQDSHSDKNENEKSDDKSSDEDKDSKKDQNSENEPPEEDNSKDKKEPDNDSEKNSDKEDDQEQSSDSQQNEEDKDKPDPRDEENQVAQAEPTNNQSKPEQDQEADMRLNQIVNDPKRFLKNKFYIESMKSGVKAGVEPW